MDNKQAPAVDDLSKLYEVIRVTPKDVSGLVANDELEKRLGAYVSLIKITQDAAFLSRLKQDLREIGDAVNAVYDPWLRNNEGVIQELKTMNVRLTLTQARYIGLIQEQLKTPETVEYPPVPMLRVSKMSS